MPSILLSLAYIAISGLMGLGIVLLSGRFASHLLVLSPLLGISATVSILHIQTLVGGVGRPWGTLPVIVIGVGLGVAGAVRARGSVRKRLHRGVKTAYPIWIAAAIATAIASIPSFVAQTSAVIMPSANHDAFYYVSVARWLSDHSGIDLPDMVGGPATATDPPAFGAAYATLTVPLRYGQELSQAWMSGLLGVDLRDAFTPWQSGSVGMIALGAGTVVLGIGYGRILAAISALVTAISFPVLNQTLAQNADSLAGIALALGTIGTVALTFRARAPGGIALFIPALLLGATVGTYSEVLVFLAPALVVLVLMSGQTSFGRRLAGGLIVVGLSILIAAPAWFRAMQSLSFMGSLSSSAPGPLSPFEFAARLAGSLRFLADGTLPPGKMATAGVVLLLTCAITVVVGVVGAFVDRRSRPLAIGLGLIGAALLGYLAAQGNAYMFSRASDLIMAMLVPVVVVGLHRLVGRRAVTQPHRVSRTFRLGLASLLAVLFAAAGLGAFLNDLRGFSTHRVVDSSFADAETWATVFGGRDGEDMAVVVPDFFDQLWVVDSLRNFADVSYPFLRGDLGYLGTGYPEEYVDVPLPTESYMIVGSGVDYASDPLIVVDQNSRFTLLSTASDAQWVVVSPDQPNGAWSSVASDIGTTTEVFASEGAVVDIRLGQNVEAVDIVVIGQSGVSPVGLLAQSLTSGWNVSSSPGLIQVRRTTTSPLDGSLSLNGLTEQSFVANVLLVP